MSKYNVRCPQFHKVKKELLEQPSLKMFSPSVIAVYHAKCREDEPEYKDLTNPKDQATVLARYINKQQKASVRYKVANLYAVNTSNSVIGEHLRLLQAEIPNGILRSEIIKQLATGFTYQLNKECLKYPNKTRKEVLDILSQGGVSGVGYIFNTLYTSQFEVRRDKIKLKAENQAWMLETEQLKNKQDISSRMEYNKRQKLLDEYELLNKVLNPILWNACVQLSSKILIETERLKCGFESSAQYSVFLDAINSDDIFDDSFDIDGFSDEVIDAEETNMEHWMEKADTVDQIKGISKEVRTLFYSILRKDKRGVLGFPTGFDIPGIYNTFMDIFSDATFQNSQDILGFIYEVSKIDEDSIDNIVTINYGNVGTRQEFKLDKETCQFIKGLTILLKLTEDTTNNEVTYKINNSTYSYVGTLLYVNFSKAFCVYTTPKITEDRGKITISLTDSDSVKNIQRDIQSNILSESQVGNSSLFNINGAIDLNSAAVASNVLNPLITNVNNYKGVILDRNKAAQELKSDVLQILDARQEIVNHLFSYFMFDTLYNDQTVEKMKNSLVGISTAQYQQLTSDTTSEDDLKALLETIIDNIEDEDGIDNLYSLIDNCVTFINLGIRLAAGNNNISIIDRKYYELLNKIASNLSRTHAISTKVVFNTVNTKTTFNKSTYFNNILKSALSNKISKIAQHIHNKGSLQEFLLKEYGHNPQFYDSRTRRFIHPWLQELYTNGELSAYGSRMAENSIIRGLGYFTGFVPFENMDEVQNRKFHLIHYLDEFINTEGKCGFVPTFVLGDADSIRYVPTTTLDFSSADYKYKYVDILISQLKAYNQLKSTHDFCDSNNYSKVYDNDNAFAFFPSLNKLAKTNPNQLQTVINNINQLLSQSGGEQLVYDKYIAADLENGYQQFLKSLVYNGLVTEVKSGLQTYYKLNDSVFPEEYQSKLREYTQNNDNISPLKALYMNTKFGECCHIIFSGIDPIFYADTVDMQKRWKEIIANGIALDPNAIDQNTNQSVWADAEGNIDFSQRVVYFEDSDLATNTVEDGSGNLTWFGKLLSKLGISLKEYKKKSSTTDGQAFRSFESYRKILISKGEWYTNPNNQKLYDLVGQLKQFEEQDKVGTDEWLVVYKEAMRLSTSINSIKPLYYGTEKLYLENNSEDYTEVPVFHKYAEMIVIPELLPINNPRFAKLRMIGKTMQDNSIDMLASTKCVKVGAFGNARLNFASQADLNASTHTSVCRHHELDMGGFVIQNNVPYHANTPTGEGTQGRKINGLVGLADLDQNVANVELPEFGSKYSKITIGNTTIEVNGKITPKECLKVFNSMVVPKWVRSTITCQQQLSNPESLTELIESQNLNSYNSPNDELLGLTVDKSGRRLINASEGLASSDIMAKLLSVFRKSVIKQKTEGGTAVQVTPYGMDLKMITTTDPNTGEVDNIIRSEAAITWDFHYTDSNGQKQELDYFDYVDPLTGKLLTTKGGTETVEDGNELESALEKEFPGILDMIMYRIPTERAYSLIATRAVLFFPKNMGGIVAVSDAYTTIAGFDFKQYWSH